MKRFKEFVVTEQATAQSVKYKGTLNWHGENITLYCHASSPAQATTLLQQQLAKKLGVVPAKVRMYYQQNPNGIKVSEVKETSAKEAA